MDLNNEQKQMNELPEWLQKLWQISPMLARQAETEYIDLKKQLSIHSVGNCKREDMLKHFKEMNELFLEAIIEVENGIYDPVEEFVKELADKYIIIKK